MEAQKLFCFGVIRLESETGAEYLDINTIAKTRSKATSKADDIDRALGPWWTADNPQIRLVELLIVIGEADEEAE